MTPSVTSVILTLSWFLRSVAQGSTIDVLIDNVVRTYDVTSHSLNNIIFINVSLEIHTLEIQEDEQAVKLSGELHQSWAVNSKTLFRPEKKAFGFFGERVRKIKRDLWMPDILPAEVSDHQPSFDNDYLKFRSNGHIIWTQKMTFTSPCTFNFISYPMGEYKCYIKLQSLGRTTEELSPSWSDGSPVSYEKAFVSHGYKIKSIKTSSKSVMSFTTPKRQLVVEYTMKTQIGWRLKHTVVPMIAAVSTAYLSFFINSRAITARMITCVSSLLIAFVLHETTYLSVPRAPYTMALEVFTGTCLSFIWIAAMESVVIDMLVHMSSTSIHSSPREGSFNLDSQDKGGYLNSRGEKMALWVDRFLRVLYPFTFIAFNAIFWVVYY